MRFQEPTKWELFLDGFHDFLYAWDCYDDGDYRDWETDRKSTRLNSSHRL